MRLTPTNYYTNSNRYLSNSKISDWFKGKEFFYKKHILGTIVRKETDAMITGSAVDLWLTKGRRYFEKKYLRCERRNKAVDPKFTQLTARQYDEIVAMCEKIETTKTYKTLKKFKKQVILQLDKKIGLFDGLCGVPDFLFIDKKNDLAIIADLKTSRTVDPKKYYYHAKEYGYFRQQAMYQILVSEIYGIKNIESHHLVIEKDPDEVYKIQTFIIDQKEIEYEKKELLKVIETIAKEKKFKDEEVSFANAIKLTNPKKQETEIIVNGDSIVWFEEGVI